MRLPGKIRRFADHIILPVQDFSDESGICQCHAISTFGIRLETHLVTDRHRIGGIIGLQSDTALEHSRKRIPFR